MTEDDGFLTDEEEYKMREERIVLCERIENFLLDDPKLCDFSQGALVDAALDIILHSYYSLYGENPDNWESEKERLRYSCEVIIEEVEKRIAYNKQNKV